MAKKLRITLVRSPIGYAKRQKRTIDALGLRKVNQVVEKPDNGATRGMVESVAHLVECEEIDA
jgi:large subunit ribosomal protein L30